MAVGIAVKGGRYLGLGGGYRTIPCGGGWDQ